MTVGTVEGSPARSGERIRRSHRQKVQGAKAQKMKQSAHSTTMERQAVRNASAGMSVSAGSIAERRQLARTRSTNENRGVGASISVKVTQVRWGDLHPAPPFYRRGPDGPASTTNHY
jgi:hypothetical protein